MKMKKKLIFALIFPVLLSSCQQIRKNYDIVYYQNKLMFEDQFLICQLGDIHLSTSSNLDREFAYIEKAIYSYGDYFNKNKNVPNQGKPSLIILNGDIFMNATKDIVNRTFEFFESLEITYAFNYGNHDLQGSYSSNYINNYLLTHQSQYNMYKNPADDNIFGNSNYYIDLVSGTELKYQIFIMDSNCFYLSDYDSFHQDQLQWYQKVILESNGYNKMPNNIDENTFAKSLLFCHIPINEFGDAINEFHQKNGDVETYQDDYCKDLESCSSSSMNSGLFSLMTKLKSTVGIASNHDHITSTDIKYSGGSDWPIRFIYGEKTGDNIYHDEKMMGATFYNLNENTKLSMYGNELYFSLTKMYVPYEGDVEVIWQNQ